MQYWLCAGVVCTKVFDLPDAVGDAAVSDYLQQFVKKRPTFFSPFLQKLLILSPCVF